MSEEIGSPALDRQGVRDASWPEMVEIFDTTCETAPVRGHLGFIRRQTESGSTT